MATLLWLVAPQVALMATYVAPRHHNWHPDDAVFREFQWNFNHYTIIFSHEYALTSVVSEMFLFCEGHDVPMYPRCFLLEIYLCHTVHVVSSAPWKLMGAEIICRNRINMDQVTKLRCLVTWFCYQMIAKPGNKTATPLWPDLYDCHKETSVLWYMKSTLVILNLFQETWIYNYIFYHFWTLRRHRKVWSFPM